MNYYTIGMAGHIDHGKTTLTKALTNIDTDRLKEEKQRKISIELGYAPFSLSQDLQVTIIDVPGHEKFIKQMIAGIAGIHLVLIVVAADEGLMPQTKEHIEILSLLGIENAIIAITKADTVDDEQLELAKEEIRDYISDTTFKTADIIYVDGISKRGIPELKAAIMDELQHLPRQETNGALRLPIDQVFTLQGHGTIVRGTIYDGAITTGQSVTILPDGHKAKVRQLQSQNQSVTKAYAGQRVAINLTGVERNHLHRGQVTVDTEHYATTTCIDVVIQTTTLMEHSLKQREMIKLHIGTSEVTGKIIFFDRNRLEAERNQTVYCQLSLDEPIVGKRNDRFILRRPSPMETFAGGKIINISGKKHRFGSETVASLKQLENSTPLERLITLLSEHKQLTQEDMIKQLGVTEESLHKLLKEGQANGQIAQLGGQFIASSVVSDIRNDCLSKIEHYHTQYPLRTGIDKAELIQTFKKTYPELLTNLVLEQLKQEGHIYFNQSSIHLHNFQPSMPHAWKKQMTALIQTLEKQGLEPSPVQELIAQFKIPTSLADDFITFIKEEKIADNLDEKHFIHRKVIDESMKRLKGKFPDMFTIQDARSILQTSRKFLVPFLELLDREKVTVREDNRRRWI